ncbi:hypothetical protein HDU98_009864 [Podochytrium sp. JEL0797]|nr:hypothetical protein HDU98_009864 [Podochytrium sp. JEL0797]
MSFTSDTPSSVKPSPFDKIVITDQNSTLARIINRLKGYRPTPFEERAMLDAVSNVVYSTILCMGAGGYMGLRMARTRSFTPIPRFTTIASGSLVGMWIGSTTSSMLVMSRFRNLDGSYVSTVLREEMERDKMGAYPTGGPTPRPDLPPPDASGSVSTGVKQPPAAVAASGVGQRVGVDSRGVREFERFEKEWNFEGDNVLDVGNPKVDTTGKHTHYNQYGDLVDDSNTVIA